MRGVAIILIILIIMAGIYWLTSTKKAVGESDLHNPNESTNTSTSVTPPLEGKFVVELLGDDDSILVAKHSILYAFIPSGEYPKVSKIRFRVEGVNPSSVEVRMTVFKISGITKPPTTTSAYVPPLKTTTTYVPPPSPQPIVATTTTAASTITYTVPEPPPGGGPGPPHLYPYSIVADNVLVYSGADTEAVFDASYLFLGFDDGVYEVRFWAWVYVPDGEYMLVSDYVTFKLMVYNYEVYWVSD